jgi:hypothetical protein
MEDDKLVDQFYEWITEIKDSFPNNTYQEKDDDGGPDHGHTWALLDGCYQAYTVKEFSTFEECTIFSKIPVEDWGKHYWKKICFEELLYEVLELNEPIHDFLEDKYEKEGTTVLTKQSREEFLDVDKLFPSAKKNNRTKKNGDSHDDDGHDERGRRLREEFRKKQQNALEMYRKAIISIDGEADNETWKCRNITYWRFLEPYHFAKLLLFRPLLMDKDIFILSYLGNGTWEHSHFVLIFVVECKFIRLRVDINGRELYIPESARDCI